MGDERASTPPLPFGRLDFVYTPSRDVAADVAYVTDAMGGRLVFAIEAMGTRVAMVELGAEPPRLLLTDHLSGDRPILIYQVADLETALADLEARGWHGGQRLEIPPGPCCSFRAPGGHRFAIYQPTRPEVVEGFRGRRDF